MDKLLTLIKKQWAYIAGAAIGALAGYLYWYFVGCETGTCPLKSSPWAMILWGGLFGSLIFDLIFGRNKKKTTEGDNIE